MESHLPSSPAMGAIRYAGVHIAKIGGDNAGDLKENHQAVTDRLAMGARQILVVSAVRSSSPDFSPLADPAVADMAADGRRKPGFNTTSHLIQAARSLEHGRRHGLDDALVLCKRIADFTRQAIGRNLENQEDAAAIAALQEVVGEVIDRPDAPHGLATLFRRGGTVEHYGEDWEHVTQKREGKEWAEDGRRSVTGVGEELAQALYAKYFRMKGMKVGQLSIHTDAMRKIAAAKPHPSFGVRHLREEIALQIQCLFQDYDVIVAGGYLPHVGSQRGYSDKTGAIVAAAARDAGFGDAVFLIEKKSPIMSGDPSRLPNAKTVPRMSYFLAKELFGNAHGANGAAVHPEALDLLAEDKIPTVVHNPQVDDPARKTLISDYNPPPNGVEIVAARKVPIAIELRDSKMIGNPGFLSRVSSFFAKEGISIDQVATSEGSVSLTFTQDVPGDVLQALKQDLNWEFASRREEEQTLTLSVLRNKSLIYCLGNNMNRPGIAARATLALEMAGADIHLITQGLNECVMTFMIDDDKVDDALSLLHDFCVLLPEEKTAALLRDFRATVRAALDAS